ncbi:MAG: hypothetical protein HYT06_01000 [Candidatus Levybacteria bacterium]|nr:hypothetical protein [Candidatus Levybacteria bacterium]
MEIVADLHLHSRYSRAVSKDMNLPTMAFWAQKKTVERNARLINSLVKVNER